MGIPMSAFLVCLKVMIRRLIYLFCAIGFLAFGALGYAKQDDLIKTKCYKTEDPVGEVCLFEDRRAIAANKAKYQDTCEEAAKLSVNSLLVPELRVVDSGGAELDRVKIPYLSTLNLMTVRVAERKTFYTSRQNSACSVFRGGIHSPFWVSSGKISYFTIGEKQKNFMTTLRKSWLPVYDGFLEATSEPSNARADDWKTTYRRYQDFNGKWGSIVRVIPELTEFESVLNEKDFPARTREFRMAVE